MFIPVICPWEVESEFQGKLATRPLVKIRSQVGNSQGRHLTGAPGLQVHPHTHTHTYGHAHTHKEDSWARGILVMARMTKG